ncbi:ABC transporter permease [Gandjariella thermophila]|uniref:Transport permease protein n=1 Tax=Gandjariella thermophila TaxID=1931992 RepID=A0A4D4J6H2_9PSEU|nr:ABC transporter permease [Gandjariella thermophila]GDY32335.1 transport permease protein [Gandjariella thermophila]
MTTTLNTPERAGSRAEPARSGWHGTGVATQILVLTGRSLRAIIRDPRLIVFNLLQPLVMLALFSQVFSSIAHTPGFPAGVSYINYLMPAIIVTTGIGSALQSGIGLVTDMKSGVLARFRSLPIRLSSVLVARSLADLARSAVQLVIMVLFATVVFGFSPAGGWTGVVAALLLGLVVSWGLAWVFLALGSWLRNAEAMQSVGFLAMFPLMFASSAYVPVSGLPGWLQAVAKVNPLTYAVDAARNLALAMPVGTGVVSALVTSLLLAVLGVAFAVPGFRRP